MKSVILLLILVLLTTTTLFAQRGILEDRSNDAFNEVDGKLSLYFIDALTGEPIDDAQVLVQNSGVYETDMEGVILFETEVSNGNLGIWFQHPDYYKSEFKIEIMAGSIFFNRFSVSPKMRVGNIRIVLDWSDKPKDLDVHFVKHDGYHISYRNMRVAEDGSAKLDIDDTDGFGPETITVNTIDQDAHYYFYVEDYTNKGNSSQTHLAESRATIKIFDRVHGLVKVLPISTDLLGDRWNVFEIEDGKIIHR